MLKHKNITILGTSHIAKASLREIENAFKAINPDIIGVELDKNRMHALLTNKKPSYSPALIPQLGLKGYLFAVIGAFLQQKLGNIVGVKPGSDMLKALVLARDHQKRIALLDRDVRITLARLSKAFKWKDKLNLLKDILLAPFTPKSKRVNMDLSKVPSEKFIITALKILKKRYPGLYSVLVEERNIIMALKIKALMENYPEKKILVVIGAGHEQEILNLIKKAKNDGFSAAKPITGNSKEKAI